MGVADAYYIGQKMVEEKYSDNSYKDEEIFQCLWLEHK